MAPTGATKGGASNGNTTSRSNASTGPPSRGYTAWFRSKDGATALKSTAYKAPWTYGTSTNAGYGNRTGTTPTTLATIAGSTTYYNAYG